MLGKINNLGFWAPKNPEVAFLQVIQSQPIILVRNLKKGT